MADLTNSVLELLDGQRHVAWIRVDRRYAQRYAHDFVAWPLREASADDQILRQQLIRFLRRQLEAALRKMGQMQTRYAAYLQQLSSTHDERAARDHMLDFLRYLGASTKQLRGDQRAFDRWFGADGVAERYESARAELEREMIWLADRLGDLSSALLSALPVRKVEATWQELGLEKVLLQLLTFGGDARVREAGFRCITRSMVALPQQVRTLLDSTTIAYTYRAALDRRQPIWIQCEAMSLIGRLVPTELLKILQRRLENPPLDHPSDLFYRRRAVGEIAQRWPRLPALAELLDQAVIDPSAYVRQGVADVLSDLPLSQIPALLQQLMVDEQDAVVAQTLLSLPRLLVQGSLRSAGMAALERALAEDRSSFVARTALHVIPIVYRTLLEADDSQTGVDGDADHYRQQVNVWLTQLHQQAERVEVRRWAARARGHLWHLQPHLAELRQRASALTDLPLSKRRRMDSPTAENEAELGRMLATVATDQFGFDLTRRRQGWTVLRDYRWGTRLWRLLIEWRRSASDKRQNYNHVKGRIYRGLMHVPAPAVAEVSQTQIPGEPLQIADEGGYRPYLPLLDQLLSCLDQGWPTEPLRVYTAEGVTWLTPPKSLWGRAKAKWRLIRSFDKLARLRNWTPASPFTPDSYLNEISELGFSVSFSTYVDDVEQPLPSDPQLARFFPATAPVWFSDLWRDGQEYFYSVYQNTLAHLLSFVAAAAGLFFGSHLWANWQMRRARAQIPLVVGGWGTRGKSGTERLKAAVFNALGHRTVSKTTGCEAMFMYGHPNRPLREMFLFRPYDKATIWEQVFLVRLSAKLKADIFLWECMGLTPRYIRILQRQWMRDDLATICNCFPDHEDIQGPAGVDIPQVMQMFVPPKKVLVTSEENMLPYLTEAARQQQTQMHTVNWLQANLLTPDILQRFPYEEHPYNIALVTRLSELLGLPADFALKEMADRVVADLGVLKAYAPAPVRSRQLEFINGCSANERHGTLSNWARMGMAEHNLNDDAKVWTSTVVNNRADRIARSQVFAAILVRDIGADRHFLIGGNLDGFMSYVRDAFDKFAEQISWEVSDAEAIDDLRQKFVELARRWRIPVSTEQASNRLQAMLAGLDLEVPSQPVDQALLRQQLAQQPAAISERVLAQWQQDTAELQRFDELNQLIGTGQSGLQNTFTDQLWEWLEARFVPIEDYHATGNQIIDRLCEVTPPGLHGRTMGVQNIKGTGLDFVYRWQAWGAHYDWCQGLLSDDPNEVGDAAKALAGSQEFGLLEAEYVADALEQARQSPLGQTELVQAELVTAVESLQDQTAGQTASSGAGADAPGEQQSSSKLAWWEPWAHRLEAVLDSGDAVKRRRRANLIYRELAAERISHARAAKELKALTSRQKGGWLVKQIRHRQKT